LEQVLPAEIQGVPLILDADAIALGKDKTFHENAILTPHPGEFAEYTGLSKDEILADPLPILKRTAEERRAVILFKGHVLYIVSFDGRAGLVDGMLPVLAAGGTGDLLAGFCAGIAGRMKRAGCFNGYDCAAAAAALLVETGKAFASRFADPMEFAGRAAFLAGRAWLPGAEHSGGVSDER
jgi:NAD(P)H-hydrate epimerase